MSSPTAPNLSITPALKHPPTLSTVAPYLRCLRSLKRAACNPTIPRMRGGHPRRADGGRRRRGAE
eukprot:418978-Prymnesium_polylepis.1